jgi:hypothetical protein
LSGRNGRRFLQQFSGNLIFRCEKQTGAHLILSAREYGDMAGSKLGKQMKVKLADIGASPHEPAKLDVEARGASSTTGCTGAR